MLSSLSWDLLVQAVTSLVGAAAAVALITWSKPLRLPLPDGPLSRWLRSIPVLATVAIIGIMRVWFTDCIYLQLLKVLILVAIVLCIALMILHYELLRR